MRKPIHGPLGKGFRILLPLSLLFYCQILVAQPCPIIVNCHQSNDNFCDESFNDATLWNDAPFTYSQSIESADLHEGEINLNIQLKGCNGGGLGIISYSLYLDLDNDGFQETVLTSGNPPPPGLVMANNSFNPGFTGGDTVRFDKRALPDSMLYRFALEINYSGDTTIGWMRFNTDAAPFDFVPVQLPEGRHRIEWRASQDGLERYCDRNFKVKDCKKPNLTCKSGLAVFLDVTQTASLSIGQALEATSDNITPDSQLVLGIRRVGTGSGFPLDGFGNPQDTIMFNCENADNQFIELWVRDKADNLQQCITQVLVYDTAGFCPFVPNPTICARSYSNGEIIRDVTFSTQWSTPNQPLGYNQLFVNSTGCSELSSLPPASNFTLEAAKDTFPLNGVTTYDLVLISKHILDLEPFDAGWKISAADVNLSNSVSTFDIVELRKLILGLTVKLPGSTPSWRFYVDTCTVWGNPFYGNCPSEYALPMQALSWYPPQLSFKGLKMGDVNGTASNIDTLQGIAQTRGQLASLEIPDLTIQTGETIEIPIRTTEGGEWEGLQFSLKYDSEVIEIEEVVASDMIDIKSENWAKPETGVLNLSWSDAIANALFPGDPLLYLRVKAHSTARLSDIFSLPANARIQPEAYDSEGINHPVELIFSQKPNSDAKGELQVFNPLPNPTTGSARLPLRLTAPETVSLEISDLSGKTIWRMVSPLESGNHFMEIPAAALSQSGVYVWRVFAGKTAQSGRLVRL
ncbi:MAG: T9SS type A sorting domain-containing protein [Saprospiraceae bacterium]|nr:T9SS type A sorting domain-containing protein [Saprospiraceae bacterium]